MLTTCQSCGTTTPERIAGLWICQACGHEWDDGQPSPAGEGAQETLDDLRAALEGVREVINCRKVKQLGCDCREGGVLAERILARLVAAPSLPPERAALVERLLRRVAESSVCNAFHSAMGQPHCQRCGRNEDLHLLREAAAALRGETGAK